jgi:hypothetical protein
MNDLDIWEKTTSAMDINVNNQFLKYTYVFQCYTIESDSLPTQAGRIDISSEFLYILTSLLKNMVSASKQYYMIV